MINFFLVISVILLNFLIIYFYQPISRLFNLFDYPDYKRKIHNKPIPLIGGLMLVTNLIVILLFNIFFSHLIDINFFGSINNYYFFFIVLIFFFAIGYLDDKYQINANSKLLFTSLCILLLMHFDENILLKNINLSFTNYTLHLRNLSYFVTLICFLLFINAFNMLDGINGQVTLYAIFIFVILIFNQVLPLYISLLVIMFLFFLVLNLKNKAFLGDSGSLPLGYMISYIFLRSYNNFGDIFLADEIFLIMSIPGYELLRLAIQRIINKKHPFFPDNNHIHHLLIKKYKPLKTMFIIQLILVAPYFFYLLTHNFFFSFLFSLIIYVLVIYIFNKIKNNIYV
jgi:UDP-GlcNAc:undecaprenyl-phosphate GlcNAc-1-phosphate transferase